MKAVTTGRPIAYLHLDSPHAEYPQIVTALADYGVTAVAVHLDNVHTVDWTAFDGVNLRMCRGFHERPDFLDRIRRLYLELDGKIPILNSMRVAVGTLDKRRYLSELEQDGIAVIPTRWVSRGEDVTIDTLMTQTGWDHVVIKPTVSAGSWRTFRVSRSGPSTSATHFVRHGHEATSATGVAPRRDTEPETLLRDLVSTHHVCVQPFLSSILAHGELSFVFLGGKLSHAVRKRVARDGGWWAHERFGGRNEVIQPTPAEREWAYCVYEALENRYGPLIFGRVDGLRDEHRVLRLLECELVIPRLLLTEGNAYDTYAKTIARAVGG
ncbi:hypothetical protein ThrDRAFT_02660 [Frankia casuarinae]|uniref:ATP-grasp domain-containing protein n=1 Tax=Frankia casuarinae (strain DSM 45818 / CECT 9043 / HFP020203 / CcI3) TaxID=106370 RepID=Q2JEB5_FRACC|nr:MULTISPECIES: hypothetical protein [Frankia]ABD10377.1 hypothetical protein Francci3_0994 [Frankia casuarinae]ETA01408.1 hypothetical protein CcI6DRAFT_03150 [Frankia sp. CcI6]EYT91655.1 hypothetical protein ThrDRAFT_02660 [Frankia casuarinae]KDA41964.1 hypothetical protein BMG523Draft_03171 [Frankia sp. BMG5.23]OFB41865.1 hypothetical protein Manayef4_16445 [Frankia sp. CgIM4]